MSRRGTEFIALNFIRVLNILSLAMVGAASSIMIIISFETHNFFFFDGASNFVILMISLFLILSEMVSDFEFCQKWFIRHWPMLSLQSGFVFLGGSMIVLGFQILGNLNKEPTSQKNLGMPLWRTVIAAGITSSGMGLTNLIATYVCCESENGLTARAVRKDGATAPSAQNDEEQNHLVKCHTVPLVIRSPEQAERRHIERRISNPLVSLFPQQSKRHKRSDNDPPLQPVSQHAKKGKREDHDEDIYDNSPVYPDSHEAKKGKHTKCDKRGDSDPPVPCFPQQAKINQANRVEMGDGDPLVPSVFQQPLRRHSKPLKPSLPSPQDREQVELPHNYSSLIAPEYSRPPTREHPVYSSCSQKCNIN